MVCGGIVVNHIETQHFENEMKIRENKTKLLKYTVVSLVLQAFVKMLFVCRKKPHHIVNTIMTFFLYAMIAFAFIIITLLLWLTFGGFKTQENSFKKKSTVKVFIQ